MTDHFFSDNYFGRGDLFQDLSVWKEEKYRELQGTYPVIFFSFADMKETTFPEARKRICQIIKDLYNRYDFLLGGSYLNEDEKKAYQNISVDMEDYLAVNSLKALSD